MKSAVSLASIIFMAKHLNMKNLSDHNSYGHDISQVDNVSMPSTSLHWGIAL